MKSPISELGARIIANLPKPGKPVPCSGAMKSWWQLVALPLLKSQSLSELRRNDQTPPRLVTFFDSGAMDSLTITDVTGPNFGGRAKDAAARTHQLSALLPGVRAAVLCSEAWALKPPKGTKREDLPPNLGDHPDRYEVCMYVMLHRDPASGDMMQMHTMIEVLKVLGQNRSASAIAATKFGEEKTTDPAADGAQYVGRFVYGSEDDGLR